MLASPLNGTQPTPEEQLALRLGHARQFMADAMMRGLNANPTPAANANLRYAISHNETFAYALLDVLVAKGLLTEAEVLERHIFHLEKCGREILENLKQVPRIQVAGALPPKGG